MRACAVRGKALLLAALLFLSGAGRAEGRAWYVPDYVSTQSGGYVGYLSAGAGYWLSAKWDTEFLLGYVPESEGGEEIWQATWKNSIHPFKYRFGGRGKNRKEISVPYIGAAIIYGFDDDLFFEPPGRYPEGYYPPTAIHTVLSFGASARLRSHGVFVEGAVLDAGLRAYFRNFDHLSIRDVMSLAAGYRFYL